MEIKQLTKLTDEIVIAFENLMPQLVNDYTISLPNLFAVLNSKNTFLYVAEENGEIIGTLTLIIYTIPSGKKASIEDVVVDYNMRGNGIARKMIHYAIDQANSMGIEKIDLTSSPYRVEANALYQSIGFLKRTTNVYRFELKKHDIF